MGFLLCRVKKIRTRALCVISGRHRVAGNTKDPLKAQPVDATFQNLQLRPCCCFNLKSGGTSSNPVASGMVIVL